MDERKIVKAHSGLALALVIVGLFVPLVGIIMIIVGIVLAHKARKINNQDGVALAAMIIGYISIIIGLLLIFMLSALLFSFVDFGSVIPNKIEVSSPIQASVAESFLSNDEFTLVFTYIGPTLANISISESLITTTYGKTCQAINLRNIDTSIDSSRGDSVAFLNGQQGVLVFKCDEKYSQGDTLEGNVKVLYIKTVTGLEHFATGTVRMNVVS